MCATKGTHRYFYSFWLNKPKLHSRRQKIRVLSEADRLWKLPWLSEAEVDVKHNREKPLTPPLPPRLKCQIESQAKFGQSHQCWSKRCSWSCMGHVQPITWAGYVRLTSGAQRRGGTLGAVGVNRTGERVHARVLVLVRAGKWIWGVVPKRC